MYRITTNRRQQTVDSGLVLKITQCTATAGCIIRKTVPSVVTKKNEKLSTSEKERRGKSFVK
jgi:hypothetical protein